MCRPTFRNFSQKQFFELKTKEQSLDHQWRISSFLMAHRARYYWCKLFRLFPMSFQCVYYLEARFCRWNNSVARRSSLEKEEEIEDIYKNEAKQKRSKNNSRRTSKETRRNGKTNNSLTKREGRTRSLSLSLSFVDLKFCKTQSLVERSEVGASRCSRVTDLSPFLFSFLLLSSLLFSSLLFAFRVRSAFEGAVLPRTRRFYLAIQPPR